MVIDNMNVWYVHTLWHVYHTDAERKIEEALRPVLLNHPGASPCVSNQPSWKSVERSWYFNGPDAFARAALLFQELNTYRVELVKKDGLTKLHHLTLTNIREGT